MVNKSNNRATSTILPQLKTLRFEHPRVFIDNEDIREIAHVTDNKLFVFAKNKKIDSPSQSHKTIAIYKISEDGNSLFHETQEEFGAHNAFIRRYDFDEIEGKPDMVNLRVTQANGTSIEAHLPKQNIVLMYAPILEKAQKYYDTIIHKVEELRAQNPSSKISIPALPNKSKTLKDGTKINHIGNEFRVSSMHNGTKTTNIYILAEDGDTITLTGTDTYNQTTEHGAPSGTITYRYFEEDGVQRVESSIIAPPIDKTVLPPLITTKDRSTLEKELFKEISYVRTFYKEMSEDEKRKVHQSSDTVMPTHTPKQTFAQKLMAELDTSTTRKL